MFGLALLAGSGAKQLLELPRSGGRAGERAAGSAVRPGREGARREKRGRGGVPSAPLCTAPKRGRGKTAQVPEPVGGRFEPPVTSSKSGKNSACKGAVGAALQLPPRLAAQASSPGVRRGEEPGSGPKSPFLVPVPKMPPGPVPGPSAALPARPVGAERALSGPWTGGAGRGRPSGGGSVGSRAAPQHRGCPGAPLLAPHPFPRRYRAGLSPPPGAALRVWVGAEPGAERSGWERKWFIGLVMVCRVYRGKAVVNPR